MSRIPAFRGLAGPRRSAKQAILPFDPSQVGLTGLLWFDAQDLTTLWQDTGGTSQVSASGQSVARIDNKFGGTNGTQSTESLRGVYKTSRVNGFPAIWCDGSTAFDLAGLTSSSGQRTVVAVYQQFNDDNHYFLDVETGRLICASVGSDGGSQVGYYDGTWRNMSCSNNKDPEIISWVFGASTAEIFKDGSSLGTAPHTNRAIGDGVAMPGLYNASGNYGTHMHLCELLIYDGAISSTDHAQLITYLTNKWLLGQATSATPSITVTTQGVDAVSAVAEQFTVSAGQDEEVTFSDGTNSGSLTFDAGGLITNDPASPPSGYSLTGGGTGQTSATFLASSAGVMPDMAKTSGGGGTVSVDIQGVDSVAGVAEVVEISFGGATSGNISISGSSYIEWDASAADVEAAMEAALSLTLTVTGSAGEFEVTYDDPGARTDLVVTRNLLTV